MFELKKSFGLIIAGVHKYWSAGTQFVTGVDDEIISLLHRAGAMIEPVKEAAKRVRPAGVVAE